MGTDPMTGRRPRTLNTVGTLLAAVLAFGCGGTAEAPTAGSFEGFIPDLRGERVMVFPVQIQSGVPGDASLEIDFALRTRSAEVDWIFSDELEAVLARSPAVESAVRGLPVGFFLRAEVRRIGDPLFGQLLRLGGAGQLGHRLDSGDGPRWGGRCGWDIGRGNRRDHFERADRTGDLVRGRGGQAGLGVRLRIGRFGGGSAR